METMGKIDIRDLSIGDWVCAEQLRGVNNEPRLTPPMKVVGLGESWVNLEIDTEQGDPFEYKPSEIRGVPITAEMLEKNGFELTNKPMVTGIRTPMLVHAHYVYRLTTDNTVIDVDSVKVHINIGDDYRSFAINCVQYIHELQHALRLAKVGKEIVL